MLTFVLARLVQATPVLFLSTVVVFLLIRMIPGDPAQIYAGSDATPQTIQAVRQDMGLDQPLPVQYIVWAEHIVQGDFGRSLHTKLPVATLIGQRLPATLELTIAAMVLTVVIGLPTGIVAAVRPRGAVDWIVTSLAGVAHAIPGFWVGILAIILFALILGWLPAGGHEDFISDPLGATRFLFLPAMSLALATSATVSRLVKSSMREVLYEDYVRTAHAKGLGRSQVVVRHALRNALVPVVTVLGLQFGRLLGGSVVIESVFAWPGLGRMTLDAIGNRDYLVVQAALLLLVVIYILVNLLTDLTYGFLDPRIRLGRSASN